MNPLTSRTGSLRPVNKKAVVLLCLHAFLFAVVFCFAFFVRSDFSVGSTWAWLSPRTLLGVVAIKSGIFYALGHCHASWRRVSFNDLTRLVWAATLSMLVLTSVESLILTSGRFGEFQRVPRSVFVLDWAGTVLAIGVLAVHAALYEGLSDVFLVGFTNSDCETLTSVIDKLLMQPDAEDSRKQLLSQLSPRLQELHQRALDGTLDPPPQIGVMIAAMAATAMHQAKACVPS
jgi:hypothetical protein